MSENTNTTAPAIPDNASAHARAWWNANHPDDQITGRGAVSPAVLIAWTMAGMPEMDVKPRGSKSAYKFEKGELSIFRQWCEDTNRDSSLEESRAAWFEQDKPKPTFYGIAAVITARRINKDGSLSKAKTVDFYVTTEELAAHRTTKQGRIPAMDYVAAAADQLSPPDSNVAYAPVRIATRTAQGEGETHVAVIEGGDDGSEFTTAGNWVSNGNERLKREREEKKIAEAAKDETIESQAAQLDEQAAQLAELQRQVAALLAAQGKSD